MQIQLVQSPLPAPLPVDAGYYVPALQNKPGELQALGRASDETWERMTPLVQFVGPKGRRKPLTRSMVRSWVLKVAAAVGSHPFFLDALRLDPAFPVATTKGDVPVLEQIYGVARQRQMRFIPVVWLGESTPRHDRMVADAALRDGHGLAVRYRLRTVLPPADTALRDYLAQELTRMGVDASDADLLVDLEYLDPDVELEAEDVAVSLQEMLDVGRWRSLVVLGTSIPSMLSCIEEGSVGSLPRREWDLWSKLMRCDLPRAPAFGDYAVQHPRPPQDGGGPGMRANIRYTTKAETLVARGRGSLLQEGKEQYRTLCQQLTERSEFAGRGYCWGDEVIEDCARGLLAPGGQALWRGAGTSHHLRFVMEQIRGRQVGP